MQWLHQRKAPIAKFSAPPITTGQYDWGSSDAAELTVTVMEIEATLKFPWGQALLDRRLREGQPNA